MLHPLSAEQLREVRHNRHLSRLAVRKRCLDTCFLVSPILSKVASDSITGYFENLSAQDLAVSQ